MKKTIIWSVLSMLIAAALLLASCGKSTTTATTTVAAITTSSSTPVGPVVLTVTNGSAVKTYSLADLQALKSVTGKGGTKGKGGTVNGPYSYQGVALVDLLNAVNGIAPGQSVKTTASDGYTTTISYDQIVNGGFSTYDATGNPVTPATKPVLAVVFTKDGAALDSSTGPVEIGLLCTESLVSDGNIWAKMLQKIDIVSATAATSTTTTTMITTVATTATATTVTTTTSAIVTTTSTTVPTTPVILTVINGSKTTTFSMAQLQQLPAFFATTGTINMKNVVSGPDAYVGVELKDLLSFVGGFTTANSVTITGSDGYSKTLNYAMVQNGTGINVLDGTGASVTPNIPPIVFLAYSKNGAALDNTIGPLDFGYATSAGQYTIANTWVKMATTITIIVTQ